MKLPKELEESLLREVGSGDIGTAPWWTENNVLLDRAGYRKAVRQTLVAPLRRLITPEVAIAWAKSSGPCRRAATGLFLKLPLLLPPVLELAWLVQQADPWEDKALIARLRGPGEHTDARVELEILAALRSRKLDARRVPETPRAKTPDFFVSVDGQKWAIEVKNAGPSGAAEVISALEYLAARRGDVWYVPNRTASVWIGDLPGTGSVLGRFKAHSGDVIRAIDEGFLAARSHDLRSGRYQLGGGLGHLELEPSGDPEVSEVGFTFIAPIQERASTGQALRLGKGAMQQLPGRMPGAVVIQVGLDQNIDLTAARLDQAFHEDAEIVTRCRFFALRQTGQASSGDRISRVFYCPLHRFGTQPDEVQILQALLGPAMPWDDELEPMRQVFTYTPEVRSQWTLHGSLFRKSPAIPTPEVRSPKLHRRRRLGSFQAPSEPGVTTFRWSADGKTSSEFKPAAEVDADDSEPE